MNFTARLKSAWPAAAVHFVASLLVASVAAGLVFGLWFPGAYRNMAGGTELFFLIVSVDVVCGPLLTLVLFDPLKRRRELVLDLSIVAVVQLAALLYGLWTVWQVRPLYLPFEMDRFKVVALHDLRGADTSKLPAQLQPSLLKGPQQVGLRPPKDSAERNRVLLDALAGGADYGERPDFYIPFDAETASKTLSRSRSVMEFLARYPEQNSALDEVAKKLNEPIQKLRYLPITARKNWIAVLTPTGQIAEFVPGDGF